MMTLSVIFLTILKRKTKSKKVCQLLIKELNILFNSGKQGMTYAYVTISKSLLLISKLVLYKLHKGVN